MALLTDLSKAFDCLPYRLLICKLRAYGLSVNACELLKSYFCERKQRVKLGDKYSDWLGLSKGVPQGSLMGPFNFNIFSNDLLLLLETHGKKCFMYEGAKLWNSISNGIKTIKNISEFKTLLKKWNGSPCICKNCIICTISYM